jgi:hypothetical protein
MENTLRVTYKRGNLVWREMMSVEDLVGMLNRGLYTIIAVEDTAVEDTLHDLIESFEHNDRAYTLAIYDNDYIGAQGMRLKDFPVDVTSFEYLYDNIKAGNIAVVSWIYE